MPRSGNKIDIGAGDACDRSSVSHSTIERVDGISDTRLTSDANSPDASHRSIVLSNFSIYNGFGYAVDVAQDDTPIRNGVPSTIATDGSDTNSTSGSDVVFAHGSLTDDAVISSKKSTNGNGMSDTSNTSMETQNENEVILAVVNGASLCNDSLCNDNDPDPEDEPLSGAPGALGRHLPSCPDHIECEESEI
ncbi:hypothetical protein OPT61_g344 [Boeremia exigua]|uniref:Uncharacterized protein n=1 Tax=Boeremia exigua TaxID=749465 RepID=A0ACC2IU80_9PLEO|nr:hypothetical protein OPT61_g344 [Boeremia exigua]